LDPHVVDGSGNQIGDLSAGVGGDENADGGDSLQLVIESIFVERKSGGFGPLGADVDNVIQTLISNDGGSLGLRIGDGWSSGTGSSSGFASSTTSPYLCFLLTLLLLSVFI